MFNLPRDDRSSIADWIELELALDDDYDSISKATVSSILEQDMGNSDEHLLTDVWRLLERRQSLYDSKPFHVTADLVTKNMDVTVPESYLACLFFSLYGVRTKRSDPKLLERIAAISIAEYLGGVSYVFGWPPHEDIPANIKDRFSDLTVKMRERLVEFPADKYKDRGVDVVSWKPFKNEDSGLHRSGQIAVLAQCAAGQDWQKKTSDVPLTAWKQYIHWASEPIRGFVVPGVIQDENWHDMSTDSGLVFDRARIYNNWPENVDQELVASIRSWVDQEKLEALS